MIVPSEFVKPKCCQCEAPTVIVMHGYATEGGNVELCSNHAMQLARKLLEDLCEVVAGDRHG